MKSFLHVEYCKNWSWSKTGLTAQQVKQRIAEGYDNAPVDPPSKSTKEIIKSNVFTYFQLDFHYYCSTFDFSWLLQGSYFPSNYYCQYSNWYYSEIRSKKVLDDLSVLNAPKSHVLREGKVRVIPAERLVLDDIVVFTAGTQIPADATVVGGEVE